MLTRPVNSNNIKNLRTTNRLTNQKMTSMRFFRRNFLRLFRHLLRTISFTIALTHGQNTNSIRVASVRRTTFTGHHHTRSRILRLPSVTQPTVTRRHQVNPQHRAARQTLSLHTNLLRRVTHRRRGILTAFTRQQSFSIRRIRTMRRVFTRHTFTSRFFRITINHTRSPRISLSLAVATSPTRATIIRGTRRLHLRMQQRFTSFVRGRHTLIHRFRRPQFTATLHTDRDTKHVTRRLTFNRILQRHHTIRHRRQHAIPHASNIANTHRRFFTNTNFALSRRQHVGHNSTLHTNLRNTSNQKLTRRYIRAFHIVIIRHQRAFTSTVQLVRHRRHPNIDS